jgi:hypothetical protein
MRAYSMGLRVRVLADCDAGLGTAAVAAKYRVSAYRVPRLKQRRRASGQTGPQSGAVAPVGRRRRRGSSWPAIGNAPLG